MAVGDDFLFPRTISVTRPQAPTPSGGLAIGKQPYQGVRRDLETAIAANIPASIQSAGAAKGKGAELVSDASSLSTWNIYTPEGVLAKGTITERDIVTDDLGKRYQVVAAYWVSMGYSMRTTLLQT